MKLYSHLLSLLVTFILYSCNPKISTSISQELPALSYDEEVIVLQIGEAVPEGAVKIGKVKIGDTGFTTNCKYEVVLEKAKLEARKNGGNILKIIEHQPPSILGSSCHRITAEILKVEDISSLQTTKEEKKEELLDIDHAIFYVYRPSGLGPLVSYDLNLGNKTLCRVNNKFKDKIKVYSDGLNTLWAKTESKVELPIDVQIGKEYYIRCGVKMGVFVGRPSIEIVDKYIGESEYNSITEWKNTSDFNSEYDDQIIRTNGDIVDCEIISEDDNTVYFYLLVNDKKVKTQLSKTEISKIVYGE